MLIKIKTKEYIRKLVDQKSRGKDILNGNETKPNVNKPSNNFALGKSFNDSSNHSRTQVGFDI